MKKSPDFTVVNQKTFVDIPSSSPAIEFTLPRVGISNRPIILTIADPFSGNPVSLPCTVTTDCSLRAGQRGLHMSRIEEAFDEVRGAGLELGECARILAEMIKKTQEQTTCSVALEAQYENRVHKNRSGKSSVELIRITSRFHINGEHTEMERGVLAPFINACPCTQRWGMRSFFNVLQEKGFDAVKAEEIVRAAPLQAHTNRGTARLSVCAEQVTFAELYAVLDGAVPIIRELLKGTDEDAIVTAAHQAGQFCEDNARAIIGEAAKKLGGAYSPDTLIDVSVEVDESVHFHNLHAGFRGTLSEIVGLIAR